MVGLRDISVAGAVTYTYERSKLKHCADQVLSDLTFCLPKQTACKLLKSLSLSTQLECERTKCHEKMSFELVYRGEL